MHSTVPPLADTLSKRGFGELIGVSPGRVSQMIADGLPVEPNGRIAIAKGSRPMSIRTAGAPALMAACSIAPSASARRRKRASPTSKPTGSPTG